MGTEPGLVAPGLTGTWTVSLVTPAGKVTGSLTGVKESTGASGMPAEMASVKLAVSGEPAELALSRAIVTSKAPACWLTYRGASMRSCGFDPVAIGRRTNRLGSVRPSSPSNPTDAARRLAREARARSLVISIDASLPGGPGRTFRPGWKR